MKSITDVFAKSVIDVLTNQEQIEARASIRLALTADSRLAIRTIQAIVESGQLTAAATPSPESFADLLLEFIDPVVINALIATPYEPTDIGSIAAMAFRVEGIFIGFVLVRTQPIDLSHHSILSVWLCKLSHV